MTAICPDCGQDVPYEHECRNKTVIQAEFGAEVLRLMEENVEWDSDLWEQVMGKAYDLKLARASAHGMFERTEKGR